MPFENLLARKSPSFYPFPAFLNLKKFQSPTRIFSLYPKKIKFSGFFFFNQTKKCPKTAFLGVLRHFKPSFLAIPCQRKNKGLKALILTLCKNDL
jgi:hypothetical protein